MNKNYRLYSFVNFYLSSIQAGIQTAHMVAELMLKYNGFAADSMEWANKDRTLIVLNGGNCDTLMRTWEVVLSSGFDCARFEEDEQSLNGALTCVGVVLPESYWGSLREQITDANGYFDGYKLKDPLADVVRKSELAR